MHLFSFANEKRLAVSPATTAVRRQYVPKTNVLEITGDAGETALELNMINREEDKRILRICYGIEP